MSRYMIDKLLIDIDRTDEGLEWYRDDPAGFVAAWEERGRHPEPPHPAGGALTDEERDAFVALDYESLYRLGAHPYLLWHVVRAVLVNETLNVHELSATYVSAITPHGWPDFGT